VGSYDLRSSLRSQQPQGSSQPPTQTGAFLSPLEQKAFVAGINPPSQRTLSSGSYFAYGSGVSMVTRPALHRGSLNLGGGGVDLQEKNKIQIELQATKLVSMACCWCQIHNTDLSEGTYMTAVWGDSSPVKCSEGRHEDRVWIPSTHANASEVWWPPAETGSLEQTG